MGYRVIGIRGNQTVNLIRPTFAAAAYLRDALRAQGFKAEVRVNG